MSAPAQPPPAPAGPPAAELLRAARPAVLVSAAAECLAGAWISGAEFWTLRPWVLALGAVLIFAAGALFERAFAVAPPRPPGESGARLPSRQAGAAGPPADLLEPLLWRAGWLCLLPGLLLGASAGREGALAGVGVALVLVLYAAVTRPVWGAGFLTLAAARALDLLFGLTAGPIGVGRLAVLALPVALYAAGWAVLGALLQRGAPPTTGFMALLHLGAGFGLALYQANTRQFDWLAGLPFWLLLLALVFPRLVRAVMDARRPAIEEGIRHGLLGLTLLEAGMAGGYAGVGAGVVVALFGIPLAEALRRWPVLPAPEEP